MDASAGAKPGAGAGEILSKETVDQLDNAAKQCLDLKREVDGSVKEMGFEDIDDIFKKFDEDPGSFLAVLPMIFAQVGKLLNKLTGINSDADEQMDLAAAKPAYTPTNFGDLKKLTSKEVAFKPNRSPVIEALKEENPNLYDMIEYSSSAIGVPFGLIAAAVGHESVWGTALSGDEGTSGGLGHFKKSTYKMVTSQSYYRDAMQLAPGEEPPKRGENALSDVLAIACLYRYYFEKKKGKAKRKGIDIDIQRASKKDIFFVRAFYHYPKWAMDSTERYVKDDYDKKATEEGNKKDWLIGRYAGFANKAVRYDKQYKAIKD